MNFMKVRKAAVEGRFYPGTRDEREALIKKIEDCENYQPYNKDHRGVIGAVLPHAGHIYSAYQTIPLFQYLVNKKISPTSIVILNPNHRGFGAEIALDENDYWENDQGILRLDRELSDLLPYPRDSRAHNIEHSAEVILPFIQYYYNEDTLSILPVSMATRHADACIELGYSLYSAAAELKRDILVIASSDFSHFLSESEGYRKDQLVLDCIAERDIYGLEKVVQEHDISVCGSGPIMALMAFADASSRSWSSEVLARGHSGEVSPSSEVVDYISILFYY